MQPRVLLVDDEPHVTEALKRVLREEAYDIRTASSARTALQILARETVDVVVSDERMPGMSGSEFLATVRRSYPNTVRILLTGHANLEAAVRAINEGEIYRFLTKPCKEADLTRAIEHALRRKEQEQVQILGALVRVGQEMISVLGTPVLLDRLCQLTTEVLDCDCSYTFLWQPKEDVYVPVSGHGDTPEQWEAIRVLKIPRAEVADLLAHLERAEVAQVVTSAHQDLLLAGLQMQCDVMVCLYLALRRGGEIFGIHLAGYHGRRQSFTPQQECIARGMAQIASMALENAQLVEKLERTNHLKEEFLATMSHEMRTPLSIIRGYNELLLESEFGPLTAEQADALGKVDKSSRALLELVNATLDLSRLEAGRLPVEIREIRLSELMSELEAETQELGEKPGLSFVWKVAPDLPLLRTDLLKLKVVIKNLICNAAKFTDQGSVTVDVHARNGGVEICVTDTGVGIAAEALPVIFEMFRQADSSLARRYGGVGLGLHIVRRLLELLGGTITVESEVGHGSTFRLWLPAGRGSVNKRVPSGK